MQDTVVSTNYQYSGYLSTLIDEPDFAAIEAATSIVICGDELKRWPISDLPHASEWHDVPGKITRTPDGVRLEGDFRSVTVIDSLSETDPRYWCPLGSVDLKKSPFPIDATAYPIVEVTYRCTSERAHPTLLWTYLGGSHFGALPKSSEWITVARNMQHFGFPKEVSNLIIRLYSPTRTVESLEVKSIRFRAMTQEEWDKSERSFIETAPDRKPRPYPILDEFMPRGVYMDAESAKRLAVMLGISVHEYWDWVLQDLVYHYHNTVVLAHADRLTHEEWQDLLESAMSYGVRFIPRHDFPVDGTEDARRAVVENHVQPYAESPAIFARMLRGEPIEDDFRKVLAAKKMFEAADPNHPLALVARYPNAYPMFAPYFMASGVGHFASRRPWDVGEMVRQHVGLSDGQQFWVAAPAFAYPMDTPEWSSCPEMRLMCNLGFANGARGWLSYSYHNDPVWLRGRVKRTLTGPFLMFSDLWMEMMNRMKEISAIEPLLLAARPVEGGAQWYANLFHADREKEPVTGGPPVTHYMLASDDFELYATVSMNTRDMVGVDVKLPGNLRRGMQAYDLSHFIQTREWAPVAEHVHYEMFPGQSQYILMGSQKNMDRWHDVLSRQMLKSELLALRIDLRLPRAYGLNTGDIERVLEGIGNGNPVDELDQVARAKDEVHDLTYATPDIVEPRSQIIAAGSAICAADGALCRVMRQGKLSLAQELGHELIPVTQELTRLRLDLRSGGGGEIRGRCKEVVDAALELLARVREQY